MFRLSPCQLDLVRVLQLEAAGVVVEAAAVNAVHCSARLVNEAVWAERAQGGGRGQVGRRREVREEEGPLRERGCVACVQLGDDGRLSPARPCAPMMR